MISYRIFGIYVTIGGDILCAMDALETNVECLIKYPTGSCNDALSELVWGSIWKTQMVCDHCHRRIIKRTFLFVYGRIINGIYITVASNVHV